MIDSLAGFLTVWMLVFFGLGAALYIGNEEFCWYRYKLVKYLYRMFFIAAGTNFITIIGLAVYCATVDFLGKL